MPDPNPSASQSPAPASQSPPAAPAEPATAAAGEPATVANGSPTPDDYKALYLKELEKRRELERASQTASVPPAPSAAVDPQQAQIQEIERAMAEIQQVFVQSGGTDPYARAQLANYALNLHNLRLVQANTRLLEVPEAIRPRVIEAMRKGQGNDPVAVARELQNADAAATSKDKEAEIAELRRQLAEKQEDEQRRQQGAVGLGRPLPVVAQGSKFAPRNLSEALTELDRLERAGDEQARAELSARIRRGDLSRLPVQ